MARRRPRSQKNQPGQRTFGFEAGAAPKPKPKPVPRATKKTSSVHPQLPFSTRSPEKRETIIRVTTKPTFGGKKPTVLVIQSFSPNATLQEMSWSIAQTIRLASPQGYRRIECILEGKEIERALRDNGFHRIQENKGARTREDMEDVWVRDI